MAKYLVEPVDEEVCFDKDEIIVSKTDLKGRIIYANDVFCRVAGFSTAEVLGEPHSMIRHPDMPRCVFKLLWDTLESGNEIFAYVKNMARDGRYYWVLAHVTPTFDANGQIVEYHSNRRFPNKASVKAIEPLYAELLAVENKASNAKQGMEEAAALLVQKLQDMGKSYDAFIWEI